MRVHRTFSESLFTSIMTTIRVETTTYLMTIIKHHISILVSPRHRFSPVKLFPSVLICNQDTLPPVAHCLDTLRQVLMCNVDTGVLGQVWTLQHSSNVPEPFPDFNTAHKCKNYDTVRSWAETFQMPPNEKLPPGYITQPEKEDVIPFIPKV
jgi:hypothetical protein